MCVSKTSCAEFLNEPLEFNLVPESKKLFMAPQMKDLAHDLIFETLKGFFHVLPRPLDVESLGQRSGRRGSRKRDELSLQLSVWADSSFSFVTEDSDQ